MAASVVVLGLGFGDEGKGSMVDYLTRKNGATLVVRSNGGSQAAHRVVLPDGTEHIFSQWGSGTLAGARTYLDKEVIIDPLAMVNEAIHLQDQGVKDPWSLLSIHPEAIVVTTYHRALNRFRELKRGASRHGSCGLGIGAAVELAEAGVAVRAEDISGRELLGLLDEVRGRVSQETGDDSLPGPVDVAANLIRAACQWRPLETWPIAAIGHESVIFEGAQGALLDQRYGFFPHVTRSDCTGRRAMEMAREADMAVCRLGVIRAFHTRHGAGPLPTESKLLTAYAKDARNGDDSWQGQFRWGWLDAELLSYALEFCPVDGLAITHVDLAQELAGGGDYRVAVDYDGGSPRRENGRITLDTIRGAKPAYLHPPRGRDISQDFWTLGEPLGVPVEVLSYGPLHTQKREPTRPAEAPSRVATG